MRLQQDAYHKIKNSIHATQVSVIFLAGLLTVAVFTQSGSTDGRTAWFFGLCWLSIPIVIYLAMVPKWSRAQRFANLYAFAVLDAILAVFWFSAWIAVASYVNEGKGKGKNTEASGCENFGYGNATKCRLSEATIFFGILLAFLFGVTSYISFRNVMDFRRTGITPSNAKGNDFCTQTQDEFSSDMQNDDLEAGDDFDPRQRAQTAYRSPGKEEDDQYALLHQADHGHAGQVPISGLGVSLPYDTVPPLGDYDTGHETRYDRDAFR